jgi:hypothetical protein
LVIWAARLGTPHYRIDMEDPRVASTLARERAVALVETTRLILEKTATLMNRSHEIITAHRARRTSPDSEPPTPG